jgi:chromosome segregation ATPase
MLRERIRGWQGIALAAVSTAGLTGVVAAQSARPTATLDDLLAEVRGLRAEIHDVVASGIRAQVLATRLSLQEQRIKTLTEQIAEARRAVSSAASDRSARSAHLRQLEQLRREGKLPASEAGDFDAMLSRVRQDVAQARLDEQTLHNHEQALGRTLSEEQRLWMELSSRLEQLDRALPAPHRP